MNDLYKESKNPSRDVSNRYKSCTILEDRETGESLLAMREIVEIPLHVNDIYHKVSSHEADRLDTLAHIYYKNPLLWWIIAQANNIYDPLTAMSPGDIIRIPAFETLYGNNGILL